MNLPNIIGITGRAGAGKDTLADFYVEKYGYVKLSFATPLKEALTKRFGLKEDDWSREFKDRQSPMFGWGKDANNLSLRSWAQWLGTDFARKLFGENCWIDILVTRMLEYPEDTKFVISDVRFDAEAVYINDAGGLLICVKRREADVELPLHTSEAGIDTELLNYTLYNNSTIEAFKEAGARIIDYIQQRAGFSWRDYVDFINSTWHTIQPDEFGHAKDGLVSEVGEVAGLFQRAHRGDGPLDHRKLEKELGDVIYYWTKLCELYGLNPEDVIALNRAKISDRQKRGVLRGAGDDR